MLRNAAQRPKSNAKPFWVSENNLYCVESLRFCRQGWKIHCLAKIILALCVNGFNDS